MKPILKRVVLCAAVVGVLYFSLFDTTQHGTECHKLTSPNGIYIAERCLLQWVPGGDSKYVGRVLDAKSGKKLAQHTFSTPEPTILWFVDGTMSFSTGGDDDAFITLPASTWDKLLAARPHL
ncbi:hypothetical protein SBC1_42820 (plasmid) [Caballeronia sp. SBC1]|uniref:hypothetical protein n=1 Tax=unclassified Caballeronia TaxID=2646786 RepID=UPI0013E10AB6|nr:MULTISPECIES: hypothetical protein [unclassified Caballeronia]QIE26441.1 hypothetical protein SBC2_45110 [Caballeronia sp. SBC2]QIN64242.1 hypothetical protein SBC1_42820 [Caballeronia sp. SBC1]